MRPARLPQDLEKKAVSRKSMGAAVQVQSAIWRLRVRHALLSNPVKLQDQTGTKLRDRAGVIVLTRPGPFAGDST